MFKLDKSKIRKSWGKHLKYVPGLVLTQCVGSSRINPLSSLPLSLPPSPHRYWELGERARAQLTSRITVCSTHCLPPQPGGGRGQGPCNVTLWCQKTRAALRTVEARSLKERNHISLVGPRHCDGHVQIPFLYSVLYNITCTVGWYDGKYCAKVEMFLLVEIWQYLFHHGSYPSVSLLYIQRKDYVANQDLNFAWSHDLAYYFAWPCLSTFLRCWNCKLLLGD